MNFNNLYYFKVLAEYEHYSRAAEALFITQPSLSHAINALEMELGVELFEKQGRNVCLTKYGRLLNEYMAPGFQEIEKGYKILRQFSRKESGIIDMGFIYVMGYKCVPSIVETFLREKKNADITINLNQCSSEPIIEKIEKGLFDLGLCTYIQGKTNINFVPVLKQNLICISSLEHPLAGKEVLEVGDILSYPIINYANTSGEIQERINNILCASERKQEVSYVLEDEVTMAGFVSASMNDCVAVVPDLKVLEHFNVKKYAINHPEAYRYIYLATLKNRPMAPCVKLFYDYLIDFMEKKYGK